MSSCPYPEIEAGEFWKPIRERAYRERIPLHGSLELTFRCNLRCVHCYITQAESIGDVYRDNRELTTGEVCNIIDQVVDEGCLFVLFTGGEPLLRSDFAQIYTYARRKGLFVLLFTNATLLTSELADLLAEWPPRLVEISLYGATQETYERVTGIPGSYHRCRRGIDLLLERGIRLRLKTMALSVNYHELDDMRALAEGMGLDFRYDAEVHAAFDGSHVPWDYRLSPEEVVHLERRDPRFKTEWEKLLEKGGNQRRYSDLQYRCGAGQVAFHVDPHGLLTPCLAVRHHAYDLRAGSFRQDWRDFIPSIREERIPPDSPCARCLIRTLCRNCAGNAVLETGRPAQPSEYFCRVAHLRAQFLGLPVGASPALG
jgi:radical SAM protein with 4Fe4S-binding SPASM domain